MRSVLFSGLLLVGTAFMGCSAGPPPTSATRSAYTVIPREASVIGPVFMPSGPGGDPTGGPRCNPPYGCPPPSGGGPKGDGW